MEIEWKQVIISLLIGIVIGASLGWWGFQHPHYWMGKDRYSYMLERFSSRLDLTPEQKKVIGDILEENRQKIMSLRTEIRPRFEEIRRSTSEDIRRQLTPGQQKKFDAMQTEWESKRREHYWYRNRPFR